MAIELIDIGKESTVTPQQTKFAKDQVLKGAALYVLESWTALNITSVVYAWGMFAYDSPFKSALSLTKSEEFYADGGMTGPWWRTPRKEQKELKERLVRAKLVEVVDKIVDEKKTKALRITARGKKYLENLKTRGMAFEAQKGMRRYKKFFCS